MNIYDGCVRNDIVEYRDYKTTWNNQLNKLYKKYTKLGYKVVFVSNPNRVSDGVRIVLYKKDQSIPYCMQEYDNKIVKLGRKWISEYSLEICDNCGKYKICNTISSSYGTLCNKCDNKLNYKRHLNGKREYIW